MSLRISNSGIRSYGSDVTTWVGAHRDDELLSYIHDDLIHYSGEFHSVNLLGFRVKPDRHQMDNYQHEFRGIASALREHLFMNEAKMKYLA
jgi:hypothetical protein